MVRTRLDEIGGAGSGSTFSTSLSGVANDDLLQYNSATGDWENETFASFDDLWVRVDATNPLTANWDVGAFTIQGTQFISDIAIGTSPFVVTSTTVVTNLNADLLDGEHASVFFKHDGTVAATGNWDMDGSGIQNCDALEMTNSPFITMDGGGGQGDNRMDINVNVSGWGAIWLDQTTFTFAQAALMGDQGGTTALNAAVTVNHNIAGVTQMVLTSGDLTISAATVRIDGGTLYTDIVNEDDANQGVTVDGVLIKDGKIDASYISGGVFGTGDFLPGGDSTYDLGGTGAVWAEAWVDAIKSDGNITVTPTGGSLIMADGATFEVDVIDEATAAAGVTIDGVLVKDSLIAAQYITAATFAGSSAVVFGGTLAWGGGAAIQDSDIVVLTTDAAWLNLTDTGDAGSAHTHTAARITPGTFPAGNYTFSNALLTVKNPSATENTVRLENLTHGASIGAAIRFKAENAAGQAGHGDFQFLNEDAGLEDGVFSFKPVWNAQRVVGIMAEGLILADGLLIEVDVINEAAAAAGVTIDGVLVKDSLIGAAYISGGTFGAGDFHPAGDSNEDLGASGSVWAEVWTDAIKGDGNISMVPTGGTVSVTGILSATTLAGAGNGTITGLTAADVAGGTFGAGDFHPAGDSNEDLGATGSVWAEVWVDKVTTDNALNINAVGTLTLDIGGTTELTITAGSLVTKDGASLEVDIINEATAAAGVTIDSVLLKDGLIADAAIAEAGVTQHEAALTILESQITDSTILARLAAGETVTGAWTFDNAARIVIDDTSALTAPVAQVIVSSSDPVAEDYPEGTIWCVV